MLIRTTTVHGQIEWERVEHGGGHWHLLIIDQQNDLQDALGVRCTPRLVTTNIRTYTGEEISVLGCINVKVQSNGQEAQLPLLVVTGRNCQSATCPPVYGIPPDTLH